MVSIEQNNKTAELKSTFNHHYSYRADQPQVNFTDIGNSFICRMAVFLPIPNTFFTSMIHKCIRHTYCNHALNYVNLFIFFSNLWRLYLSEETPPLPIAEFQIRSTVSLNDANCIELLYALLVCSTSTELLNVPYKYVYYFSWKKSDWPIQKARKAI